mmetsp:Transcript_7913/g.10527  ORF Transcript_7913/g.10527 Transcript_7913/m.10527 type:complete len:669 (-) Transcript_7913:236-2242(-)
MNNNGKGVPQNLAGDPNLDKVLDVFAKESFTSDQYAKKFYQSNAEKDAPQKWMELNDFRNSTEDMLKQLVFQNYKAFLDATNGIQSMQSEISSLKRVLQRSQAHLSQMEKLSLQNASFEIVVLLERDREENNESLTESGVGLSGVHQRLPRYVTEAPDVLKELLMERQYTEAVAKILKVQEFWRNLNSGTQSEEKMNAYGGVAVAAKEIYLKVQEISEDLASKLFKEVSEKHMQVWRHDGLESVQKAHKLLIDLGKADQAVRAFTQERSGNIRRVLRTVEVAGDTISYVRIVTDLFFTSLGESCKSFLQEFSGLWPSSQLVIWVDEELAHYASLLGRQIRAARLLSSNFQRRMTLYGMAPSDPLRSPKATGRDAAKQRRKSVSRKSWEANVRRRAKSGYVSPRESLDSTQSHNSPVKKKPLGSPLRQRISARNSVNQGHVEMQTAGVIVLVQDCLVEAFEGAAQMKEIGMPVVGRLAELLVPELKEFIGNLEQIVRAANAKVLDKEGWLPEQYFFTPPASVSEGGKARQIPALKCVQFVLNACIDVIEHASAVLDVGPSISSWCDREDFGDLVPLIPKCVENIIQDFLQACEKKISHGDTYESQGEESKKQDNQDQIKQAMTDLAEVFLPDLSSWCLDLLPELPLPDDGKVLFKPTILECKRILKSMK